MGCDLRDGIVDVLIAALKGLASLEVLDLSSNEFESAGTKKIFEFLKENKTIKVKNTENSVKGNDGINTATWQKDGFAYSFSSDQAMTQDALTNAIENLI